MNHSLCLLRRYISWRSFIKNKSRGVSSSFTAHIASSTLVIPQIFTLIFPILFYISMSSFTGYPWFSVPFSDVNQCNCPANNNHLNKPLLRHLYLIIYPHQAQLSSWDIPIHIISLKILIYPEIRNSYFGHQNRIYAHQKNISEIFR